ncbi:unnamed protein product, partial [Prorocentrum cordatum]
MALSCVLARPIRSDSDAVPMRPDPTYVLLRSVLPDSVLADPARPAPGRAAGEASAVAGLTRPALTKFWAAGLSFSKCHAERDVPADPNLMHIFTGE